MKNKKGLFTLFGLIACSGAITIGCLSTKEFIYNTDSVSADSNYIGNRPLFNSEDDLILGRNYYLYYDFSYINPSNVGSGFSARSDFPNFNTLFPYLSSILDYDYSNSSDINSHILSYDGAYVHFYPQDISYYNVSNHRVYYYSYLLTEVTYDNDDDIYKFSFYLSLTEDRSSSSALLFYLTFDFVTDNNSSTDDIPLLNCYPSFVYDNGSDFYFSKLRQLLDGTHYLIYDGDDGSIDQNKELFVGLVAGFGTDSNRNTSMTFANPPSLWFPYGYGRGIVQSSNTFLSDGHNLNDNPIWSTEAINYHGCFGTDRTYQTDTDGIQYPNYVVLRLFSGSILYRGNSYSYIYVILKNAWLYDNLYDNNQQYRWKNWFCIDSFILVPSLQSRNDYYKLGFNANVNGYYNIEQYWSWDSYSTNVLFYNTCLNWYRPSFLEYNLPNSSNYLDYVSHWFAYSTTYGVITTSTTPIIIQTEDSLFTSFSLLSMAFTGLIGFLSFSILPGITLGMIITIPILVTILLFVIKLFKR